MTYTANFELPVHRGWRRLAQPVAALLCVAMATVFVLLFFGGMISWDFFLFLLASTVFVTALGMARPFSGTTLAVDNRAFLSASLVIWIFLMVSEAIFIHPGTTSSAVGGSFGATAYYEAGSWILSFGALALLTLSRPEYLRSMFSGQLKWATIFALVAFLSCPLSPVAKYSFALAFKLCVIVLLLIAINETVADESSLRRLFAALFVGTLILTFAGFITPFVHSGAVFAGDRFGSVIGLSGDAGLLLLFSTMYLLLKRNPWFLVPVIFSLTLMLLVGGKGGIIASLFSIVMFFVLLKNARQALLACVALTLVVLAFVAFTPFGHSLQTYGHLKNAGTLSGRTNLWNEVWPEIRQRPIFGHGYRASRFVSAEVEGAFAEAGHIHNSFLEVSYNNGIVGLIPILIMSFYILRNLAQVLRRPLTDDGRYYAAAALALYLHLLVWGMTAPTFGGSPDNRFMTFFAVLLISMRLREYSSTRLARESV